MDSNGGFHVVEKDGKLLLVYHHPKYFPIPETHTLTSSTDLPLQPLFLCPNVRWRKTPSYINSDTIPLNFPPEYVFPTTTDSNDHHVLPLFWCNNKEFDIHGGCDICRGSNFGTDYYFCISCNVKFHRECVQSPLKIKHPYHPEHSLQLSYHSYSAPNIECLCCRRGAFCLVYDCTICQAYMHPTCAMKPIPFIIDPPKQHIHPLTFFTRQIGLTCNVCGLSRKTYPTYVCLRCNFVAHNDCMNFPHIIKISRHHHRISFTLSFPSRERLCGVCRQSVNGDYGAYTCDKCNDYAVHSICATRKDLWDGKELEGVPEEDDITKYVRPFEMISEGEILHFLHDHHLRLESIILFDENKLCQACVLPIYEGNFYSCVECEFILHENCAKAPRRIQHVLHRHPLTLKKDDNVDYSYCDACGCRYSGFDYGCYKGECDYALDVRCASISEPFDFKGHEHPLFLALNPEVKPICHVCKRECRKQLNCIQCGCNFIVCFRCVTLPYKTKYKHDTHFLTISYGEEVREKDWCEVCEQNLKDTGTKVFYWCNECYTTFHIECVLGEDPYMKLGKYSDYWRGEIEILGKCNISRPLCYYCKKRCRGKIFKRGNKIACSMKCL